MCFLAWFSASAAAAQGVAVWAPTEIIGGEQIPGMWPVIEADAWGRMHVFWTETEGDGAPGVIMHRMKDSDGWHGAVDIMLRDSWGYSHPAVLFDADTAYMIWSEASGLYFSKAPQHDLSSAVSWRAKYPIAEMTGIDQSWIVTDKRGVLHVLFSRLSASANGDGGVYYLTSADRGVTWTEPLLVSDPVDARREANLKVRAAVDDAGRVHAVWANLQAPDWRGKTVYYAHSLEDTRQWSSPLAVSNPNAEGAFWEDAPNLVIDHDGVLHLVWACIEVNRCYRFSSDGGNTWSPIQRILGDMRSLAGWDSLIVDDQNTLHLIAQLRFPENIYHVTRARGRDWDIPTPIITLPEIVYGHYPRVALSRSKELGVVTQLDRASRIYYAGGTLPGFAAAAPPPPTSEPARERTATRPVQRRSTLPARVTPTVRPLPLNPGAPFPDEVANPIMPILVSIAAPLLLVSVVVIIQRRTRR